MKNQYNIVLVLSITFLKQMLFSRKLTFKTDRLELSISVVLFTGTRFYCRTGYSIDISS